MTESRHIITWHTVAIATTFYVALIAVLYGLGPLIGTVPVFWRCVVGLPLFLIGWFAYRFVHDFLTRVWGGGV